MIPEGPLVGRAGLSGGPDVARARLRKPLKIRGTGARSAASSLLA